MSCQYSKQLPNDLYYCTLSESICSFDSPDYKLCQSKYNDISDTVLYATYSTLEQDDDIIEDEIGVDDIGE